MVVSRASSRQIQIRGFPYSCNSTAPCHGKRSLFATLGEHKYNRYSRKFRIWQDFSRCRNRGLPKSSLGRYLVSALVSSCYVVFRMVFSNKESS